MKDFVEEIGRVAKRCRRCGYDAEALHEMLVNREAECDSLRNIIAALPVAPAGEPTDETYDPLTCPCLYCRLLSGREKGLAVEEMYERYGIVRAAASETPDSIHEIRTWAWRIMSNMDRGIAPDDEDMGELFRLLASCPPSVSSEETEK